MNFEPGEAAGYTTGGLLFGGRRGGTVPPFIKWGLGGNGNLSAHIGSVTRAKTAFWPVAPEALLPDLLLSVMTDDETVGLRATVIGGIRYADDCRRSRAASRSAES
jgi:hypothetical protein